MFIVCVLCNEVHDFHEQSIAEFHNRIPGRSASAAVYSLTVLHYDLVVS